MKGRTVPSDKLTALRERLDGHVRTAPRSAARFSGRPVWGRTKLKVVKIDVVTQKQCANALSETADSNRMESFLETVEELIMETMKAEDPLWQNQLGRPRDGGYPLATALQTLFADVAFQDLDQVELKLPAILQGGISGTGANRRQTYMPQVQKGASGDLASQQAALDVRTAKGWLVERQHMLGLNLCYYVHDWMTPGLRTRVFRALDADAANVGVCRANGDLKLWEAIREKLIAAAQPYDLVAVLNEARNEIRLYEDLDARLRAIESFQARTPGLSMENVNHFIHWQVLGPTAFTLMAKAEYGGYRFDAKRTFEEWNEICQRLEGQHGARRTINESLIREQVTLAKVSRREQAHVHAVAAARRGKKSPQEESKEALNVAGDDVQDYVRIARPLFDLLNTAGVQVEWTEECEPAMRELVQSLVKRIAADVKTASTSDDEDDGGDPDHDDEDRDDGHSENEAKNEQTE